MAKPSKSIHEIEAKATAKAWKDPAFKKKLLSNPKAALEEMGCTFQPNTNVRIYEDNANTYTFVLRASPVNAQSLPESELEKLAAAGGCIFRGTCVPPLKPTTYG
jgi:hypothetical protein